MVDTLEGTSIFWSATERRARKEITKAFKENDTQQWVIGDLLNMIAPMSAERTQDEVREAESKLKIVAEENGHVVRTIQEYRRVAATFPDPRQRKLGFNIYSELTRVNDPRLRARLLKMIEDGTLVTVDTIRKARGTKPTRPGTEPLDLINEALKLVRKLDGVKLNSKAKVQLRVLRLALDNVIESA